MALNGASINKRRFVGKSDEPFKIYHYENRFELIKDVNYPHPLPIIATNQVEYDTPSNNYTSKSIYGLCI